MARHGAFRRVSRRVAVRPRLAQLLLARQRRVVLRAAHAPRLGRLQGLHGRQAGHQQDPGATPLHVGFHI